MREAILNETVLKDIALQIVQQGILSNWQFYAFLLALSLISGAIGAFLSKYVGKRGETAAVDADLKKILRQLEKTTEVAEQVRSKVDHADWVAREWKTIRRVKLEELVKSAISVEHWLDKQCSACRESSYKEIEGSNSPAKQTEMIAALYFPEIQEQSKKLVHTTSMAIVWMNKKAHEINKISNENKTQTTIWIKEETTSEWMQHWNAVSAAISEIKTKAAEIMRDMQTI